MRDFFSTQAMMFMERPDVIAVNSPAEVQSVLMEGIAAYDTISIQNCLQGYHNKLK